jgi:two-component system NarL family sensor kinase
MLSVQSIIAQNQRVVDSLTQIIDNNPHDTVKVKALNDIAVQYILSTLVGAEKYLHEALQLSTKIDYDQGKLDALNRLGVLYYRQGIHDSSLHYYKRCLPIATARSDTAFIIKIKGNIALVYTETGNYQDALKGLLETQPIEEEFAPARGILRMLDIANVYYYMEQKQKALDYAMETLEKGKAINNAHIVTKANSAIGAFLRSLERPRESLVYLYRALEMMQQSGDQRGQVIAMINIGNAYSDLGDHHGAIGVLDSVVVIADAIKARKQKELGLMNLGVAHTMLKNYADANVAFVAAYDMAKVSGSLSQQMNIAGKLGANYQRLGKHEDAADFYQLQTELKDTIFKAKLAGEIADMQTKYQTERVLKEKAQEEKENEKLKKKNAIKDVAIAEEKATNKSLLLIFSCIAGVVLLLLMVIYFRATLRRTKEKSEQEKMRFKAVLEAEEQERIRIAKELHDGLGQLLSTAKLNVAGLEDEVEQEDKVLVNNSMNLIDEAVEEVRSISHNLMPAALMKYGLNSAIEVLVSKINEAKLLKVDYHSKGVEDRFEQHMEIALYRITQEVLNNMLKHSEANAIAIELVKQNRQIHLSISDNGQGFETSKIEQSEGIGWTNIYSRAAMINGDVDVWSKPREGTKVKIIVEV